MLEVTAKAGGKFKEYLEHNKIESAVRMALMGGCGCNGRGFSAIPTVPLLSAAWGCGGSWSSDGCGSC